jgi:YHS domain-containing protein
MKSIKLLTFMGALAGIVFVSTALRAEDPKAPAKLIPYTLKTCIVSGEKLGSDMGGPVVYAYKGREIKFCCKDCRKDFDKDPAKYIKKIEEAEAKAKAKAGK